MSDHKFLGICIVIAAAILSWGIQAGNRAHRYEFHQSNPPGVRYIFCFSLSIPQQIFERCVLTSTDYPDI
jgi:hypothetical protein